MTSSQPRIFQNAVLRSLPGDSIERLRLKPVKLEADRRIAGPEDSMWWLYFIEAGSVALSVPLKDGSAIDTGVLGSRSMVGARRCWVPLNRCNRPPFALQGMRLSARSSMGSRSSPAPANSTTWHLPAYTLNSCNPVRLPLATAAMMWSSDSAAGCCTAGMSQVAATSR